MSQRFLRPTMTALAMVLGLAGCNDDRAEQASAGGAPARSADLLKVGLDSDPICLDPQQAGNGNALAIGRQLLDSLTDQDPQSGEIRPWLAQRWDVREGGRQFVFHLREDATFSDGGRVDAEAVKANYENIVALGGKAMLAGTYLSGLESVTVSGPFEVQISFKEPNAQFLQASSTMSLGLLSQQTLKRTSEERCQGQLAGSGPFVLSQYVPNQKTIIKRRDDYQWPSSLAQHTGAAKLDGAEFLIIPESGVRFGSLVSGQIDVAVGITAQEETLLQQRGIPTITRTNPGVVFSLFPNENRPPLNDKSVRQALNKGIDRSELQNILTRYQKPATSVLASNTPFYSDQSADLAYDPQGARRILTEAGWQPGSDGIFQRDGVRLSFNIDYWQLAPALELLQQQLQRVGIELRLNKSNIGQISSTLMKHEYSLAYFNLTRADPDVLRVLFMSTQQNITRQTDQVLDQLLLDAAYATTAEQRKALVAKVSSRLINEGHSIPLFEQAIVTGHSQQVKQLQYEASTRLQLYDTWLER